MAAKIRDRYGRGIAIVGQDHLRRIVLREHDVPGGVNMGLIDTVARYSLDNGYHVIVEGILYAAHYGDMLSALRADHCGGSWFYYLDVPFKETLRRHATKPQAVEYGAAEMSAWYRDNDLLPDGIEQVIPADSSLEQTVERVMTDAGLVQRPVVQE